jgi:small GTP-binding protein
MKKKSDDGSFRSKLAMEVLTSVGRFEYDPVYSGGFTYCERRGLIERHIGRYILSDRDSRMAAADDGARILNMNVGVLGHVDSGKTALVRALSTVVSTAALDKSPTAQERGITLDLGFSSFITSIPDDIAHADSHPYTALQVTLVDCPGHASLVRTVIGGAQIMDLALLVVDVQRGIQTQTFECLVIAEISIERLVVVLNKIDLLPELEREERILEVTRSILKVSSSSMESSLHLLCSCYSQYSLK